MASQAKKRRPKRRQSTVSVTDDHGTGSAIMALYGCEERRLVGGEKLAPATKQFETVGTTS